MWSPAVTQSRLLTCDSFQASHFFGRTIFLPQPQSLPTTNEISQIRCSEERAICICLQVRGEGSQPSPACLSHGLRVLLPSQPSLHGDPLSHPARRSLGPAQPCCLPRKLCWSGANGKQPATPMSTSPTSPAAGVTGSASVPSSMHTGAPDGERTRCPPSPSASLLWGSTTQPNTENGLGS